MASAPPVVISLLVSTVPFALLGCLSLTPSTSPQIEVREETQQTLLEDIDQHLQDGNTDQALEIWQRISAEERQEAGPSTEVGYLRSRLFSSRLLQDRAGEWANSQVSALAVDHDDLWIGTWLGGIARYSLPLDQFRIFQPNQRTLEPLVVYHIRPSTHYVWVLANDGIKRYDKRLGTLTAFRPPGFNAKPTDLLVREGGQLLVSTIDDGLWSFAYGRASRIATGPAGKHLTVLVPSSTLGVLVGTVDRGVFFLQNGQMKPLDPSPITRTEANVTSLVDDGDNVWIGTSGRGIIRWNHSSRTRKRYHAGNTILPDDWVEDLMFYQQNIFAVTMRGGFVAFDYQRQKWSDWQASAGLMSDTITTLAVSDDTLYYGTLGSGVVQLHWKDYLKHS